MLEKTSPIRIHHQGSNTKLRVRPKNKTESALRKELIQNNIDSKRSNKEVYKDHLESGSESSFSGGPITVRI